ncbi:hypothetical protein BB561_002467 [Smittium simulii]|uniref:Vacuolar protein sorting-associated protein 35 n=1 Tax=Smittium simulii TaxID=133385 RepID=A0A2T9YQH9_9FUNG|nr:hypothetical protein BB561_002467 [Smittium simulii]
MEQKTSIAEILTAVRAQHTLMKTSMETDKVMDALKHCSNILNQLRASALSPKEYNSLYFTIFDSLQLLAPYLKELHLSGKQNLADLYELVQYAGSVVTRLYLIITVGSAYISLTSTANNSKKISSPIEEPPVKEILFDMLEMARGVQHPIRGLFLRYYLGQMTKDYLPTGTADGPSGNIDDSIHFLLANFTEMNKLWVRMQHQGLSKDRAKREEERRDLRTLVGSNLLRLSLLDGVTLPKYHNTILPSMLSQVVSCKDPLAQEYLMEATVQAFSDECHLNTLGMLTSTLGKLHPKVLITGIIISLADRVTLYYSQKKLETSKNSQSNQPQLDLTQSKNKLPSTLEATSNILKQDDKTTSSTNTNENKSLEPHILPPNVNTADECTNLVLNNTDQNIETKSDSFKDDLVANESHDTTNELPEQQTGTLNCDENNTSNSEPILTNPENTSNISKIEKSGSEKDTIEKSEPFANSSQVLPLNSNQKIDSLSLSSDTADLTLAQQPDINIEQTIVNDSITEKFDTVIQDKEEMSDNSTKQALVDENLIIQFWEHTHKLLEFRTDLLLSDIVLICNSMLKMALTCIPESLDFANRILEYIKQKLDTKDFTSNDNNNDLY